jgi:hypothetical protein
LLSIFVIAPLGALAFDRPLHGNWIWRIDPEEAWDDAFDTPLFGNWWIWHINLEKVGDDG